MNNRFSFYSHLFAAHPTVQRDDYAKWLLDDPRVNFSIIGPSETPGVNHLGIQVDSGEELAQVHERMLNTQGQVSEVADTSASGPACSLLSFTAYWT